MSFVSYIVLVITGELEARMKAVSLVEKASISGKDGEIGHFYHLLLELSSGTCWSVSHNYNSVASTLSRGLMYIPIEVEFLRRNAKCLRIWF